MTRPWTVNSPSPITQLDDGLWAVTDLVPGIKGANRRMSIVKRADGGLLFYNAIPLTDALLDDVRRLGTPAQVLLPNHFHTLDAHAFCEKLQVPAFAPTPSLERTRTVLPSVQDLASLPSDEAIEVVTVDGFVTGEACLLVRRPNGTTFIAADVVCNVPHAPGFSGFMMRLVGFTADRPVLPKPVRFRVGKDRPRVKAFIARIAQTPNLVRLVPSHGDVLERDVPAALQWISDQL